MWRKVHNVPATRKLLCRIITAPEKGTECSGGVGKLGDTLETDGILDTFNLPKVTQPPHAHPLTEEVLRSLTNSAPTPGTTKDSLHYRCQKWLWDITEAEKDEVRAGEDGVMHRALRQARAARDARIEPWLLACEQLQGMHARTPCVGLLPEPHPALLSLVQELWLRLLSPNRKYMDLDSFTHIMSSIMAELCPGADVPNLVSDARADYHMVVCDVTESDEMTFSGFAMLVLVALEPWVRSANDAVSLLSEFLFPRCIKKSIRKPSLAARSGGSVVALPSISQRNRYVR